MRSFFSFFVDNQDLPKNRFSQWMSTVSRRFFLAFINVEYQKWQRDVASQITKSLALNSFLLFTQRKWSKALLLQDHFSTCQFLPWISSEDARDILKHKADGGKKTQKTSLMNISRNFNVNSLFKNILEILTGKKSLFVHFFRANKVWQEKSLPTLNKLKSKRGQKE